MRISGRVGGVAMSKNAVYYRVCYFDAYGKKTVFIDYVSYLDAKLIRDIDRKYNQNSWYELM